MCRFTFYILSTIYFFFSFLCFLVLFLFPVLDLRPLGEESGDRTVRRGHRQRRLPGMVRAQLWAHNRQHSQFDFCHISLAVSQCFCSDDKFHGMILIIQSSNKSFSTVKQGILGDLNVLVKWVFVWLLPECAVETPTVFWWANDRYVSRPR